MMIHGDAQRFFSVVAFFSFRLFVFCCVVDGDAKRLSVVREDVRYYRIKM
jgi:hypothetical protein